MKPEPSVGLIGVVTREEARDKGYGRLSRVRKVVHGYEGVCRVFIPLSLNFAGCMQEGKGKKLSADGLSGHDRPHFIATAVIHPNTLCQSDESLWKHEALEHSGIHSAPHARPLFSHTKGRAPGVPSEMLGNISKDTDTTVGIGSRQPKVPVDDSLITTEPDTRAGGSIRDRIAALSAAAGVSRLGVTSSREQSRVDVTPSREQSSVNVTPERELSKMTSEKGVAFDIGFQKAGKPRPPPRVISRFRTKDLERECKTAVCESQVANNRELGTVNNKELGPVHNRKIDCDNSGELEFVNSRDFGVVNSKELGVVKDKSVAFEVSFDDEPRLKRAKDEPVLMQSPFKSFKMRSNRRHQQKPHVKPLQPQRTTDCERSFCTQNGFSNEHISRSTICSDVVVGSVGKTVDIPSSEPATQKKDRTCSEVPKLLKRNTFTKDSLSQNTGNASHRELPVVKAASKEEFISDGTLSGRQQSSNYEEPRLQKRNTFTLDSVSQCTENSSEQGLTMAEILNELASREESKATEEQGLPSEHLQKRNTFTLDSESREGVLMATVLKDLASEEETKQNKHLSDETSQKRGTFTLDSVSQSIQNATGEGLEVASVLNDLASKEELEQSQRKSDVDTSALSNETSQKRSTFTLESVSREIDDAIEKYFPNELAKKGSTSNKKQECLSEKRSTYTLDSVSESLQSGAEEGLPATEVLSQLANQEDLCSIPALSSEHPAKKCRTFTVDGESQALEEAENKGFPATEVLSKLAKQEEPKTLSILGVGDSAQKCQTFTLDSAVSQTLEEAQEKGTLHQLAFEEEGHVPDQDGLSDEMCLRNQPQKRGTYTLDTVSHAIEEAVEKGIPVSVTLNHLAQEGKAQKHTHAHDCDDATAGEFARGLRGSGAHALASDHRDEFEASFEDALEQLEDCVTFDSEEAFSSSGRGRPFPEIPGNRGTFDLDEVSASLKDGAKDGVPVVETLELLSETSGISKDSVTKKQLSGERRGTYTLNEVSRSLETASEQGIPVVEALQNLTKAKEISSENRKIEEDVGKRGTYTLDEVSKSLEHAKQTGIPVIEALESLSKEKRKSPLRLKMPDRGTYTLDEVSHTLEKAKHRGLPVVAALGQLTASKGSPVRQTPDAVHRMQEKLINRKTYALASPLETIGEGTKLRLYDGNQRQMMSPISFHVKSKDLSASKANTTDSKARGLGVVQKLDFLTSACELLLEANAKEMARDQHRSENTRSNPTTEESVGGSREDGPVSGGIRDIEANLDQRQTDRNTFSLESVSLTIDDAKAKGIPVVETLKKVTSVAQTNTTQGTNRMRLNSKSDSELINNGREKVTPDRYTHSLEDVSRTLEDAKKAGIPVIQALDQLTNELAEFSLTAMSGDLPITQLGKDNRKRKRYSETAVRTFREQLPQPSPHGSPYPPPMRKAYSLGDVAFAVQQAFQSGTSLTDFLDDIAFEKPVEPASSSKDVRPRSVDSGFVSSFSDNDISSQSFESPRNRSNTYIFDSSNEDLNLAKVVTTGPKVTTFNAEASSQSPNVNQDENRRTFTFDHVSDLSRGIPVIEALEESSNSSGLQTKDSKQLEHHENAKNILTDATFARKSKPGRKQTPTKPKRQFFKKTKSPQSSADSFVIEFFNSNCSEQPVASRYQIMNNKIEEVTEGLGPKKDITDTEKIVDYNAISPSSSFSGQHKSENTHTYRQVSQDKHAVDLDLVPTKDPESVELKSKAPVAVSSSTPRGRATWRPSGSVLDKIASLMDAAEDCGISPTDVLNKAVTDLPCDAEGQFCPLLQRLPFLKDSLT